MFRIIHPNRWFFWTIAIALGMGLFVLWSIKQAEIEFYDQANLEEQSLARTFSSEDLGFSVRYPAPWQIEIDSDDAHVVTFENPENFGENISIAVRESHLEAAIRLSLGAFTEERVTLDGQPGRVLKGQDNQDRATNIVILVHYNGKLYYIAGSARVFEKVLDSFKFIK